MAISILVSLLEECIARTVELRGSEFMENLKTEVEHLKEELYKAKEKEYLLGLGSKGLAVALKI